MANDISPDFSAISDAFTETLSFGTEWLIPLALAIVAMTLITRDVEKWKVLLLPIVVLQLILGIPVHIVIVAIAGALFVFETLSISVTKGFITSAVKWKPKNKDEEFIKNFDAELLKREDALKRSAREKRLQRRGF